MSAHKEIRALTGLRGVAALYVVLFHYTYWFPGQNLVHTLLDRGYLSVDLFFILSGFVMGLNYRHLFDKTPFWRAYKLFLGRRIGRIYPLYLCGTIVGFLLIRYSAIVPDPALPHAFALNLLMLQSWVLVPSFNRPGWSLSAEWAAYLIFPVLLSLVFFKRSLRHWLNLILLLAILAAFAWLPALEHHPTFSFSNDFFDFYANQVLRCLPEFALGILVVRGLGTKWERFFVSRSWTATLLSFILITLLLFHGTDFIIVLILPLFLLSLMQTRSLPARLLASGPVHYLGLISYSLYIVHDLFTGLILRIHQWVHLHHIRHAQSYAAALAFAVVFAFAVVIPISGLTYKYIELPAARRLRRWFEGPPPAKPDTGPNPVPPAPVPDAGLRQQSAIAFPPESR